MLMALSQQDKENMVLQSQVSLLRNSPVVARCSLLPQLLSLSSVFLERNRADKNIPKDNVRNQGVTRQVF